MICPFSQPIAKAYWRIQAAQIVAELFPVTSQDDWNELLDLHTQLLRGNGLKELLNQFLKCRHLFEADHYIPFFRLRRLIEASLRLNVKSGAQAELTQLIPLRPILWRTYRSVDEIQKTLQRQRFEHDLDFSERDLLRLEVAEA